MTISHQWESAYQCYWTTNADPTFRELQSGKSAEGRDSNDNGRTLEKGKIKGGGGKEVIFWKIMSKKLLKVNTKILIEFNEAKISPSGSVPSLLADTGQTAGKNLV